MQKNVNLFITFLLISIILTTMLNLPVITYAATSFYAPTSNSLNFPYQTKTKKHFLNASNESQYSVTNEAKQANQTSESESNLYDFNRSKINEWQQYLGVSNITRLTVRLNGNPQSYSKLKEMVSESGGEIVNTIDMNSQIIAVVVKVLAEYASQLTERVKEAGLALYIEPSAKVQAYFVPNDEYWNMQWAPRKIQADWAWNTTVGNSSVLVAVIDTGIDWDHPDLYSNYVQLGYDWVNNDTDPMDDNGHGTHCAGIIAATINNSIGIAGLAQVHIMAEKVLNSYGWGYFDWVASGIIHAADQGADIISMSLGGYYQSELVHEAVQYAYSRGVLLIAAAGNDATDMKTYPAAYDEVIAVAATDSDDNVAWWSNFGDWIELAAPGVNIYSTVWDNGYTYKSGTSMACPHVAGVAALIFSEFTNRSSEWVRLWLRYTADDLGNPGFDRHYGYGRINAKKAVEALPPEHDLIALKLSSPIYIEPSSIGVINATVLNFGSNDEYDVSVQFLVNSSTVETKFVTSILSGQTVKVNFTWNPVIKGMYNITFYVVPVPGETITENNAISKYIYVGHPVKAVVLDSAGTDTGSIIATWQELNTNWNLFGTRMIYIDYASLNKECITYEDIAATNADVLIISCACDPYYGWQFTDSEIEAIAKYVREGHGLIATSGTFFYRVPNNNKLAPLFGLNKTTMWSVTGTDLLHQLNTTHPLFTKVPNPFVFREVGTAIPSDGAWDSNELIGGKYQALGEYEESSVVTFRGLIYMSPLLEIIPAYYRHQLQLLYNAITWSRYQKPKHELAVSLECPRHLKPGETAFLNATVVNMGLNNETDVNLYLLINATVANSTTISEMLTGTSYTMRFRWTPTEESIYNVTVYTPPRSGEDFTENNLQKILVTVSYAPVIGIIKTHGETLHTDELTLYYSSLGYFIDEITVTLTPKILKQYDILIIGEDWSNTPWLSSEIAAVQTFISSGGGFIAVGDELALSVQEILSSYGISYTGFWASGGSSSYFNSSHPIMHGVTLIYAGCPINSLQANAPAYWIANDASNTYMLISGADVNGHVLCLSDDFAAYLYYYDNAIMFKNMIEWMKPRYEHDLIVTLDAPASLELGKSALLSATVRNTGLNNETYVKLYLLINKTVVSNVTIPELLVDKFYIITYSWTPATSGTYNITAYAPPVPGEHYVTNNLASAKAYIFFYMRLYLPNRWVGGGVPMSWHADDYSWTYILPFNFPFYGIRYRTIYISSNGLITFTGPDSSCSNDIQRLAGKVAIAPAWDDWVTYQPHDIYIQQNSSHVIIRWDVAACYNRDIAANFEAILRADGVIQFNYGYNNGTVSATLGISNGAGHILAEDVTDLNHIHTIIFTPFQPEHELIVSLEAPKFLKPSKSALLNATVYNLGLSNETEMNLFLYINNSIVNSATISELQTGASYTINYSWVPTVEATYNITAYSPPAPNENVTANNIVTKIVRVLSARGYILFDQTHGVDNITHYNILTTNLTERKYVIETHTYGTITSETLEGYDVFVIPQAHDDYTSEELSAIQSFVRKGGGLLVIGDDNPWIYTSLTGFAGITWDKWGCGGYTSNIIPHPLTVDVNIAYFDSPGIIYVTSPALSIIRDNCNYTMLAVSEMENGKVVGIADENSIDNYHIGYADNLRLAKNIIDWLICPHDLGIRLTAPTTSIPNRSVTLNFTVQNLGLYNETEIEFYLIINSSTVYSGIIQELAVGCTNTTSYNWKPNLEGTYNITAYVSPVAGEEYLSNNVESKIVEVYHIHEVEAWLRAPSQLTTGGYTILRATAFNKGTANETSISVYLFVNGSLTASKRISKLETNSCKTLSYFWNPSVEGIYNITAYVTPVSNERLTSNNRVTRMVDVTSSGHTPVIQIDPSESYVALNQVFTVTVLVVNVTDLYGWQIKLYYDENILNFTDAWYPTDHVFAGKTFVPVEPIVGHDAFGTYIMYGASLLGQQPSFNGAGKLCTIQFEALNRGVSMLEFSHEDTMLLDSNVEEMEFEAEDGAAYVGMLRPSLHDIAITNVTPSRMQVYPGWIINISVIAKNLGSFTETFNVSIYGNNTFIGSRTVTNLPAGEQTLIVLRWNTTGLPRSVKYVIWADATSVRFETSIDDNFLVDGITTTIIRDVAITEVYPSCNWVYQGFPVNITVIAKNKGNITETFVVNVYFDNQLIDTLQVVNLAPNEEALLLLVWDTKNVTPCHNYTITAIADAVPGEQNLTDNAFQSLTLVKVRIVGDINGDEKVDMKDIGLVAKAFGSYPGHERWNPICDTNNDMKIDMRDVAVAARGFGWTPSYDPPK